MYLIVLYHHNSNVFIIKNCNTFNHKPLAVSTYILNTSVYRPTKQKKLLKYIMYYMDIMGIWLLNLQHYYDCII